MILENGGLECSVNIHTNEANQKQTNEQKIIVMCPIYTLIKECFRSSSTKYKLVTEWRITVLIATSFLFFIETDARSLTYLDHAKMQKN